jgi:hypothetical protein
MTPRIALVAVVIGLTLFAGRPAKALDVRLTDVGANPMTEAQMAAFERAAAQWERTFDDPITVRLNVAWDELAWGILAEARSSKTTSRYDYALLALAFDNDSQQERDAIGRMLTIPISVRDVNGTRQVNGRDGITMTTANAKALGLGTGRDPSWGERLPGGADASIRFNTRYLIEYDLDRTDGSDPNLYDFETVAAHEIGHALGFTSVTDTQDANPSFALDPTPLDLWRFREGLPDEVREITAGPAEYYDSVMNFIEFSQGLSVADPRCNTDDQRCGASHWRDQTVMLMDLLMDPTLGFGEVKDVGWHDKHALDYIGYDPRPPRFRVRLQDGFVGFFDPLRIQDLPDFGGAFDGFAPPPDPFGIDPPFQGDNLAVRLGLDFGEPGLERRSGLGFARFAEEEEILEPEVPKLDRAGQWEDLGPPEAPMTELPARITDFYFVSDESGGKPFVFIDSLAEDLLLLLTGGEDLFSLTHEEVLLRFDVAVVDNGLVIRDAAALGVSPPRPRRCGLGFELTALLPVLIGVRRRRARKP